MLASVATIQVAIVLFVVYIYFDSQIQTGIEPTIGNNKKASMKIIMRIKILRSSAWSQRYIRGRSGTTEREQKQKQKISLIGCAKFVGTEYHGMAN